MLDFSGKIHYNISYIFRKEKGEETMQENNNQNPEVEIDENHLIQIRKEKITNIAISVKSRKE